MSLGHNCVAVAWRLNMCFVLMTDRLNEHYYFDGPMGFFFDSDPNVWAFLTDDYKWRWDQEYGGWLPFHG